MLIASRRGRGVALVTVLVALVVMGLLLSASLVLALHDRHAGEAGSGRLDAFLAAEVGLARAVSSWNGSVFRGVDIGQARRVFEWLSDSSGWYRTTLRRTGETTYLIAVEGFNSDTVARQHLGMFVTTAHPTIPLGAALTVAGRASIGDEVTISGLDRTPPGWGGCDVGTGIAGALALNSLAVDFGEAAVTGTPPVALDPGLVQLLDTSLAWLQLASLGRSADYRLDGATIDSMGGVLPWNTCDSRDVTWPTDSPDCRDEFPVIVISGNLSGTGLIGRGMLVVHGDLRITGPFEFSGVLIVRGRVALDAGVVGRGRLWGGMIVVGDGPGGSEITGDWRVMYSRCAVDRSLRGLLLVEPLAERSWASLY